MDYELLLDKNGMPSSRKLAANLEWLTENTSWLPPTAPSAERLYVLMHNLVECPKKCKICGNKVQFGRWGDPYGSTFCSQECMWRDKTLKPKKIKPPKAPLLTQNELTQRRETANLAKYGVRYPWMLKESKRTKAEKAALLLAEKWIQQINATGKVTALFQPTEYRNSRQYLPVKCNACNTIYQVRRFGDDVDRTVVKFCGTCFTKNASAGQHNFAEWIKMLEIPFRLNDRRVFKGKYELDIWLPSHNFAIEFDGLYWHSERGRPNIKTVSKLKHEAVKESGIRLISIFEDDWNTKQDIIKSRIENQLGLTKEKIFARKCKLLKLSPNVSREFFERSHLDGFVPAAVTFGLEHDGIIVAAMSFGKSRFNKKYQWELLRFAAKPYTSVIGGASRLFMAWQNENLGASIISFSDNSWGDGKLYERLGFANDGQTPQGYFYTNSSGKRTSRQSMMKHKLKDKLKIYDPDLSERENCWNNGWYRIWNLGNTRWIQNGPRLT